MDEHDIQFSKLSRDFKDGDQCLHIDIYCGEDHQWILEIIDPYNNSIVWDKQFSSDRDALDEAINSIIKDGIEAYIGPESGFIH